MVTFEGHPTVHESDIWRRLCILRRYLENLRTMDYSLTDADKEFVGKICHSETETLLCRYLAMTHSATACRENEEYADALGYCNEAMELHDSANAMENEMLEKLLETPVSTLRQDLADNAVALAGMLAEEADSAAVPPSDPRAEANRLMHEFEGYPTANEHDLWNVKRLNIMYSYFNLFTSAPKILLTDKHYEFFKKTRRSKSETVLCRVWALEALYLFSLGDGDPWADVLVYVDKSISLCKSACRRKRGHIIHLGGSVYKIGDYLDELREKKTFTALQEINNNLTGQGLSPDRTRIISVSYIAGLTCDNCRTSLEEKGVEAFQFCSSCHLEFYCSRECQRAAWKDNGHKLVCRKKGQYKVGDIVTTARSFGDIFMGERRQIVAPYPVDSDEDNPRHWVVRTEKKTVFDMDVQVEVPEHFDAEQEKPFQWVQQSEEVGAIDFAIIPAEALKRVRPVTWYLFGLAEIDALLFFQEQYRSVSQIDETDYSIMPDLAFREEEEEDL